MIFYTNLIIKNKLILQYFHKYLQFQIILLKNNDKSSRLCYNSLNIVIYALTFQPYKKIAVKIIENRIRCLKCGDIIVSESVHDCKSCSCGACSVDGGESYLRRGGNKENWEELSILEPDNNTETDPKSAEKHLDVQEIVNEKFGDINISDDVLDEVAEELAER